jgi:hypothetical protein
VAVSALVTRRRCRSVGELVGLVDDVDGDLLELVTVLTRVVGAEQELSAGVELDTQVGLRAAAVAAVLGSQRSTRGNSSCHFGLVSRVVS